MNNINNPLLIVANGKFPNNKIPLRILKNSKFIIACDGAADKLNQLGYEPNLIIGDMDSISKEVKNKFRNKLIRIENQDENDLRKALHFCKINNLCQINIIGATGKREDHTIGNIFSINKYNKELDIKIFTDYGCFIGINKPSLFNSFKHQEISFFTENKHLKIKTSGLKYNLNYNTITTLYNGTLNQSLNNKFFVDIKNGNLIVYLKYN